MIVRVLTWAAAILLITASVSTVSAVVKKAPSPLPSKTSRNSPLTEGECRGLGGTVNTTNACDTGLVCETADKNGTMHRMCIDKNKN